MAVKTCCNLSLLPPEIIEWEILSRLPVKSVLRFKSVCKSWNLFLSSNPDFVKSHLDLNHNDSLILMRGERIEYLHDDNSLLQWYTNIIGSVNGLVCFYNWDCDHEGIEIAIWNPATKQCLADIPNLPDTCVDREVDMDDFFGFGFDAVASDFKVLYVITIEEQPLVGDIYSCSRHCWTKTSPSNFLFRGYVPNHTGSVNFRGSPYWLNVQPNGENSRLTVIWFDVRNEIFKILPEVCSIDKKQGDSRSTLMNFRDSVAIMIYDWLLFLTKPVDVYVFNERCSAWSKMSIGPLIGKEPTLKQPGQTMLQCFKNEDILYLTCARELYYVNLQTHAIKSLGKEAKPCRIVYACTYSESLVFLEGMKPFDEKGDEVGIFSLNKA